VLRAAFALPGRERPRDLAVAARLAFEVGLAPRIAHVLGAERLISEIGEEAERLLQTRRAAVARAMTLEAALGACLSAAARLRTALVPLKGTALWLRGAANPAVRPRADADLLVPEESIAALQSLLLESGFRLTGDPAYEHQAPALWHAAGGAVELHRCLPGVRLDGRRSATFADCQRAGWLEPLPPRALEAIGKRDSESAALVSLPRRPLLAAHLLAHALAQDAFSPRQSGLRWLADLWDLDREAASENSGSAKEDLVALRSALAADLSDEEIDAALDCLGALRENRLENLFVAGSRAGELLAHVVLGISDHDYAESLRLRSFERPLTDRSRVWARAIAIATTLWPKRRRTSEAVEPWPHYLGRLARRPSYLFARWRSAREGEKKLAGARPDERT